MICIRSILTIALRCTLQNFFGSSLFSRILIGVLIKNSFSGVCTTVYLSSALKKTIWETGTNLKLDPLFTFIRFRY